MSKRRMEGQSRGGALKTVRFGRAAVPQTDFADVVRSAALQPGRKGGRSGLGRRGGNGRLNRRIGTALNRAEKIVRP
ncbi:MAG: hypothetical protein ACLUHE_16520 [Christensenellales bacterium]